MTESLKFALDIKFNGFKKLCVFADRIWTFKEKEFAILNKNII